MTRAGTRSRSAASTATSRRSSEFLGSTEITYAGINEFIDNRPTQVAVALDSPLFTPVQFYAIGFAQDTWRVNQPPDAGARPPLRLLLGREGKGRQGEAVLHRGQRLRHGSERLLQPGQEQLRAAPVGGLPAHREDGAARRLWTFLRPGPVRRSHPADRELHRAPPRAVDRRSRRGLAYPVDPATYRNLLSVRGYTHERPDEYNVQYGVSVSQELPGAVNLTVGYTGSRGKDMFLRGVANTFDNATRVRQTPIRRPGRLQDLGLPRRPGDQRQSDQRLRQGQLRCAANQRDAAVPLRPERRPPVPVLAQRGHHAGIE